MSPPSLENLEVYNSLNFGSWGPGIWGFCRTSDISFMPTLASQFKAFEVEIKGTEGHKGASVSLLSQYSTPHPRYSLSPVVSKGVTRRKGAYTRDLPLMVTGSSPRS